MPLRGSQKAIAYHGEGWEDLRTMRKRGHFWEIDIYPGDACVGFLTRAGGSTLGCFPHQMPPPLAAAHPRLHLFLVMRSRATTLDAEHTRGCPVSRRNTATTRAATTRR